MDIAALRAAAPPSVRWVPRFVADDELGAYFQRADLVVLPYREIDQSGVLFTALAFGAPLLLSDVGGFGEVAAQGAAALVAPGDADALAGELGRLLAEPGARAALREGARRAADGRYSWDADRAPTSRPLRVADRTMSAVTTVLEVVFWSCVVLLAYAQVGYPLLLAALARLKRPAARWPPRARRASCRA